MENYIKYIALISATLTLLSFLIPDSILKKADHISIYIWVFLDKFKYKSISNNISSGKCDLRIDLFGYTIIILGGIGASFANYKMRYGYNIHIGIISSIILMISSLLTFYIYGKRGMKWLFLSKNKFILIVKLLIINTIFFIITVAASIYTIVNFEKSMKSDIFGEFIKFSSYAVDLNTTIIVIISYLILSISIIFIIAFMSFMNGIFFPYAFIFLYIITFAYLIKSIVFIIEYIFRKSYERKGLIALIAAISGIFLAIGKIFQ